MMEQGSLADLLTLAKSGDDNKLASPAFRLLLPDAAPYAGSCY